MDRKQFRKALCEALAVSEDIEVLEEAVGKASFGNLLDDEVITKIGKALRKTNISLNDLTFKKAPKGAYKFSKARERFLNKVTTDKNYGHVVVFVNPNTKEYLATVIADFDLRNGNNAHMVLATNLELKKANVNIRNFTVDEFDSIDLDKIQKFVNDKATVAYFAEVPIDSIRKLIDLVFDRRDRQSNGDELESKSLYYKQRVALRNNLTFKKAKEMLDSIGYKLNELSVTYGDEQRLQFNYDLRDTVRLRDRIIGIKVDKNYRLYKMGDRVFDDVFIFTEARYIELNEVDNLAEQLKKTTEVAKFLATIKVNDILIKE